MGKDKSSGNTYDVSNETFSFEKTRGNLEAIIEQYNAYVKGTTAANDAVAKLQLVIQNKQIANKLVDAGVERLKAFDTYRERPRKLVELCENILALRNRK